MPQIIIIVLDREIQSWLAMFSFGSGNDNDGVMTTFMAWPCRMTKWTWGISSGFHRRWWWFLTANSVPALRIRVHRNFGVEAWAHITIRTRINKQLHKNISFSCYASVLVFLILLLALASQAKFDIVKESTIKAKSAKNTAKFFTLYVHFVYFGETSRGTHAFMLSRMLRQNSHLLLE